MDSALEISRDELYERVWSTPINHLAKALEVSSFHLVRICEALNIPRPAPGHWQKLSVGKVGTRPELPAALPENQVAWRKGRPVPPPRKRVPASQTAALPSVKARRSGRHPILFGAEAFFRKTRKIEENEFLRPYKRLLPDIVCSESNLTRAFDVASALYHSLNANNHRVVIAPADSQTRRIKIEEQETARKERKYGRHSFGTIWSPDRPTITYIGSTPIGIALIEMTDRITLRYVNGKYFPEGSEAVRSAKPSQLANSWTIEQDVPCSRLRLVAYSAKSGTEWVSTWQESEGKTLPSMIPEIVRTLEGAQSKIASLIVAAEEAALRRQREWEEARERYRQEEHERRVAQAQVQSRKQLADIMDRWAATVSIHRFFEDAEARLQGLHDHRREFLIERLALARSMVGSTDPLDFLEEWVAPDEHYRSKEIG